MTPLILIVYVLALAFVFAKLEIHVEGAGGWAADLPTWRIEEHPLLTLFWGGRPMTGYHAWTFTFLFLMFHFPPVLKGTWSWQLEARIAACLILFWICEDFLWFVLNPAYTLRGFNARRAKWHKHWFLGCPVEYWIFGGPAVFLLWVSYRS